jgi:hypothetical protein
MATLEHPPPDDALWPSLGGQVCDWMTTYLVHGPGDVRGEPLKLSREVERLIYRWYEVSPQTGRRRFHDATWVAAKGVAKTEMGAAIAAAELLGPVRFGGWDGEGNPVGRPVNDPVCYCAAWSFGQADELAFTSLQAMLEESEFDLTIAETFIERKDGRGRVTAITKSPNRADGSRVTFTLLDEVWRWTERTHKDLYRVLMQNATKRKEADAWSLAISTAFVPGRNSVCEQLHEKAKAGEGGYFFHRYANDSHDLTTQEGREAAIVEARTPEIAQWTDVERIAEMWDDPAYPHSELEQLHLARPVSSEDQFFPMTIVKEQARPDREIQSRAGSRLDVWVGFDGSRTGDTTAFVCTTEDGFQWCPYLFVPKVGEPVETAEVDAAWDFICSNFRVRGALFDPRFWETEVARWVKTFRGKGDVETYFTEAYSKMHRDLRAYVEAWKAKQVTYSGQRQFTEHLANSRIYEPGRSVGDEPIRVLSKDRKGSPRKVDIAMSAALSWTSYLRGGAGGVKAKGSRQGSDWRMY